MKKQIKQFVKQTFFTQKSPEEYWYDEYQKNLNTNIYKSKKFNPKISIITPVYNVKEKFFIDMINSVLAQTYQNWELCLIDDCSTALYIKPLMKKYASEDSRIKIKFLEQNKHIAGASNEGLRISTGDYIAFLDNDDMLFVNTLEECVKLLEEKRKTNLVYSDNILINEQNQIIGTSFKPSWSPEFYLSTSYLIHFCLFSRETINQVGFFNEGLDYRGVQDIDIKLKVMNLDNYRVEHIAKPLYKWRVIESSVSQAASNKNYVIENSLRVYNDYLKRKGLNYFYEYPKLIEKYDVGAFKINFTNFNKQKSIVVLTEFCNDSNYNEFYQLLKGKGFSNISLFIIGQDESHNKDIKYFKSFKEAFHYLKEFDVDFIASVQSIKDLKSENLIELIAPLTLDSSIMICGGKVIYEDRLIRGSYIFTDKLRVKNYQMLKDEPGWWFNNILMQNVSAVSGYFMAFKKEVLRYSEHDEKFYDCIDIRLCIKSIQDNYRVVYNPWAVFKTDTSLEIKNFLQFNLEEKYYSPYFSKVNLYSFDNYEDRQTKGHKIINKLFNRFKDGDLLRGEDGKIFIFENNCIRFISSYEKLIELKLENKAVKNISNFRLQCMKHAKPL